MSGIYATDGSINVTVVDGTTRTGLYAANGSFNVVQNDSGTPIGLYHACGAYNVIVVTTGLKGYYAVNGNMNVSVSPYNPGCTKVTVVAGAFV